MCSSAFTMNRGVGHVVWQNQTGKATVARFKESFVLRPCDPCRGGGC